MNKTKLIQTFMELLCKGLIRDTSLREKVNGTVILSHTLKWNSFHSERPLDTFKDHTNLTCLPLNRNKSTELKPILKSCHTLLEIMHGTSNIMITLTSTSIWLMDQRNTPLKLTMTYLTQPILPVNQIHLSLALLLKKLNLLMRNLLPKSQGLPAPEPWCKSSVEDPAETPAADDEAADADERAAADGAASGAAANTTAPADAAATAQKTKKAHVPHAK